MINLETFLSGYIGCALWSTSDTREDTEEQYTLDDEFSEVSDACRAAMRDDCDDFVTANKQNLHWLKAKCPACDDWRLGFLFWLNRNGHGSGYWDEGGGTAGELLDEASKPYGSFDLYGDFNANVVRSHHYG